MNILGTFFVVIILFSTPVFAFDLNDLKKLTSATASTAEQISKDSETVIRNTQEITKQFQTYNNDQGRIFISELTVKINNLEKIVQDQQDDIAQIESVVDSLKRELKITR